MVKHKMGLRIAVELTGWKDTPSFEKSGWGQDYKTAGVKTRWWQFRAVGSAQACLQSGTKQMSRTVKWWASVSRQVVDLSRRWGASGVEWLERVEKELLTEAADPSSPQMWWLVNTCRHGVLSESLSWCTAFTVRGEMGDGRAILWVSRKNGYIQFRLCNSAF